MNKFTINYESPEKEEYPENFNMDIDQTYRTTLNQNLLVTQKAYSIFNVVKNKQRRTNQIINALQIKEDKEKSMKKLELINDAVYKASFKSKMTRNQTNAKKIRNFIIKYTNLFKVIPPQNPFLILWDIIVAFIIIYYIFEIGLVTMFGQVVWQSELQNYWSLIITYLAIIIWLADIFITFNRGFYKKGVLVLRRKQIFLNYVRFRFFIDITSLIILLMCLIFRNHYKLNFFKYLILFKFYNLNQIDDNFRRILIFYPTADTLYQICKYTLYVIISSHYYGVFFYGIDLYFYETNYYGPNTPSILWIYNANGYDSPIVTSLNWPNQYKYSLYWAVVTITTISYGDITPLNPWSTFYVVIMLFSCRILFTFIMNRLVQAIVFSRQNFNNYRNKISSINQLMYENKITNQLQIRVRSYFQNVWNTEIQRDQTEQSQIINTLPNLLKKELLEKVYAKFLSQLLVYKFFPKQIIFELCNCIQQVKSILGQEIMTKNTEIDQLYYLSEGKIMFHLNDEQIFKISYQGGFGIVQFFSGENAILSVRSLDYLILYKISREDFMNIINKNFIFKEIYRYIVDQIKINKKCQKIMGLNCYICQQNTHLCNQCPYIHYVPNNNQIIKKSKKSQKQTNIKIRNRKKFRIMKQNYKINNDDQNQEIFIYQGDTQQYQKFQRLIEMAQQMVKQGMKTTQLFDEYMNLGEDKMKDYEYYNPQYNVSSVVQKYKEKAELM